MDKQQILSKLASVITTPVCELNFNNNYELLIAVILSAQCTDKRVNEITPLLFKEYPTPLALANADEERVKQIIKPCGFFNTKSKNIISACADLVKNYNGIVPSDYEDLLSLKGVGRKTANVVRAVGFKIPSIAVDTHVFRVSNRIGIAKSKTPEECEQKLMRAYKPETWIDLHHIVLLFGRYYCKARNPKCEVCVVKNECEFYNKRRK